MCIFCDMGQSDKLRENKNQHVIKNKESKIQENNIKNAVNSVLLELKIKYPYLQFGIEKKKMLHTIEKLVNGSNYTTSDKSFIIPDGGFLWVKINNVKHYILISEQKRQGTNDKRRIEGKGKQGVGNAGERLAKNVKAVDVLFGNEDIYPFIVFLQGCDFFDEESRIGDRIRTIAQFLPMNVINIEWKQIQKHNYAGGSYFMRGHSMADDPGTSDWSFDEMFNPMFTIAENALNYYLVRYGE
jgi:type II restriction enzyme